MPDWSAIPPQAGSIATGFFPETKPKQNWASNPRPMLVLRVYRGAETRSFHVLVAYGTTQVGKIKTTSLLIGNLSILNQLNLARPTAFVLQPGSNLAVLPWSDQHFACWRGFNTPVISRLPPEMRQFVAEVLANMTDLPTPKLRK